MATGAHATRAEAIFSGLLSIPDVRKRMLDQVHEVLALSVGPDGLKDEIPPGIDLRSVQSFLGASLSRVDTIIQCVKNREIYEDLDWDDADGTNE